MVESTGVKDVYLFVVDLQLVPGQQLKKFIEGTEAAGQDDGGVAAFVHHFFAGMHIRDDGEPGKTFVMVFPCGEDLGDNAFDLYACCEGGIRHQAHEALAAAAIDQFEFQGADVIRELGGVLREKRIIAIFGAAEDCDGPDLHIKIKIQ